MSFCMVGLRGGVDDRWAAFYARRGLIGGWLCTGQKIVCVARSGSLGAYAAAHVISRTAGGEEGG